MVIINSMKYFISSVERSIFVAYVYFSKTIRALEDPAAVFCVWVGLGGGLAGRTSLTYVNCPIFAPTWPIGKEG